MLVRSTALFASFALAAACLACAPTLPKLDATGKPVDPRSKCWVSFAACAPPISFDESTDVSKLTTPNLVRIASRLDMPDKLPRAAAKRLSGIAMAAEQPQLFELESALEDTAAALERCSCGDVFKSELEKQGIADIVKKRLPPKELRSPEVWADRIFAGIASIRDMRRSSATMLAEGGGVASQDGGEGKMRQAERRLCIAVHGARAALPSRAFARALEMVNAREVKEAGEGSASAARRLLSETQELDTCGPEEPEPGAPAP